MVKTPKGFGPIFVIIFRNISILFLTLVLMGRFTNLTIYRHIGLNTLMACGVSSLFAWHFFWATIEKRAPAALLKSCYKCGLLIGTFLIAFDSINIDLINSAGLLSDLNRLLTTNITLLYIITLCFGFFTLYFDQNDQSGLIDRNEEGSREDSRTRTRPEKFPRLNRIPLLGNMIKLMHEEEWQFLFGLATATLVGLIIRIQKIGYWDYFRDEYNILLQAKINYFLGSFAYEQSWLLIQLHTVLYKIFGFSTSFLFNRLPYVLMSLINVALVYLISKKLFDKKTAVFASLIFYVSTFATEMSLYVRHYEYYLLLILLVSASVLYVRKFTHFIVINIIFFSYVLISLIVRDGFYVSMLFVVPFILFRSYQFCLANRCATNNGVYSKKNLIYLVISALPLALLSIYFIYTRAGWLFQFDVDWRWLKFILAQSLGLGTLQILFSLFPLTVALCVALKRSKNQAFLFILLVNLTIISMYTFILDRYYAPRYIYYFFPLYVILISSSLTRLFRGKITTICIFLATGGALLLSSRGYFSADRTYSSYVGTYSIKTDQLQKAIEENNVDINRELLITPDGAALMYQFYDFNQSPCIRTYNANKGYQASCNIITPQELNTPSLSPQEGPAVLITDWRRNPLKDKSVDSSRLIIEKTILDSQYKIFRIKLLPPK